MWQNLLRLVDIRSISTPIGPLILEAHAQTIIRIRFSEERAAPPRPVDLGSETSLLDETEKQLRAYFNRQLQSFDLPLDPSGTTFQKRVWAALQSIPYGGSWSYQQLAQSIGSVARAVGRANGQNPVPIIIPCHRVIGASGDLTGYRGGLNRKRWLLKLESPQGSFQGMDLEHEPVPSVS